MSVNSLGYKNNKNPVAQSIFIEEPSGIFATKIDLFFKSTFTATADLSLPVSLHLRPMRNGIPSDVEIVPGSTVYVAHNLVNTSTDGKTATSFIFEEPIFLRGLTDYAIVVYAESPEYEIYISEIDGQIIGSAAARVNVNPNLGSLFYSQNGATFTADQKQDLKFTLHRAKFSTTVGETFLNNATLPKKLINDNSIQVFEGDSSVRVFSTNHGLQVSDTVTISGATTVGGLTLDGDHTITKVDFTGYEFEANGAADSNEVGGGNRIITTKNIPYSIVYPSIQTLKPRGTNIFASFKGTSGKSFAGTETPYTVDADFTSINLNKNNFALDHNYVVAADSIADAEIAIGARTAIVKMNMTTTNDFVSPMIDLQRTSLSLVDNLIDRQDSAATTNFNVPMEFVNETAPQGGSSAAKHITKVTSLIETAVGLKVFVTANRPKPAEIELYYRTASDADDIRNENWVYAAPESTLPPDDNPRVFREYEWLIGGQSGELNAFSKYQLKIVMNTTNSAKVPVIKDLRAIALSV